MEIKIETHNVSGRVVVEGGITVVSSDRDFPCSLGGLAGDKIKAIEISPSSGSTGRLSMDIALKNGWTITLFNDIYHEETFIVTRFRKRRKKDNIRGDWYREYMDKEGKWRKEPERLGPLPRNALRIPIFA